MSTRRFKSSDDVTPMTSLSTTPRISNVIFLTLFVVIVSLLPNDVSASENVYTTSSYNQLVTSSTLRYSFRFQISGSHFRRQREVKNILELLSSFGKGLGRETKFKFKTTLTHSVRENEGRGKTGLNWIQRICYLVVYLSRWGLRIKLHFSELWNRIIKEKLSPSCRMDVTTKNVWYLKNIL